MKSHDEIAALLPAYFELGCVERHEVDEHAGSCALCAGDLAAYRQLCDEIAHMRRIYPDANALDVLNRAVRYGDLALPARRDSAIPAFAWLSAILLVLLIGGITWISGHRHKTMDSLLAPNPVAATPSQRPAQQATPVPGVSSAVRQDDQVPAEAVAWLRQNAIPFNYTEPGNGYADLAGLKSLIGDARVVVFNDTTANGTHEFQTVRQRLLEYLVQEQGFNSLILETDWLSAEPLDAFIQGEPGYDEADLSKLAPPYNYWSNWNTNEMLYTLRWLCAHNQGASGAERFSLRGILYSLTDYSGKPLELIRAYLQQVDPTAVPQIYGDRRAARDLLTAGREQYLTRSSPTAYARALRAAQWLVSYDETKVPTDQDLRNQAYDQSSLANLDRAIAESRRTIIWTRSFGEDQQPGTRQVAEHLRGLYGEGLVVLDFDFYRGSTYAWGPVMPGDPGGTYPQQVPPALPGTYEDFLHQAGLPHFILDMRDVTQKAGSPGWLAQPHYVRHLLGYFDACYPEDAYRQKAPGWADALIYVEEVTPASFTARLATNRPGSCLQTSQNLDFASGLDNWFEVGSGTGYEIGSAEVGASQAAPGGQIHIQSDSSWSPGGFGGIGQQMRGDRYRGQRIRLTASTAGETSGRVYLWLRADGPFGQVQTLIRQPFQAGNGAGHGEIVMDVPENCVRIAFGAFVYERGQMDLNDMRFETVGKDVPPSADNGPDGH